MKPVKDSDKIRERGEHKKHSRRSFVKRAGGVVCLPALISRQALAAPDRPGANDRIGVGAIGVGFRASLLLEQLPGDGRIIALSECNMPRAEAFRAKKNASWALYPDYREMLTRDDIDAVIIATQAFQRVLPCIHACQAGKDVYAEKPLTLCTHEGRVLVDIVRKHKRILQVGTQQRSMEMNRVACDFIRNGGLGKIKEVRAVNYTGPRALPSEPFPAETLPQGFNWDVWLNQAAWREYNPNWMHGYLDMFGGEMTNWGAHGIDQVQWALGMDHTGPVESWPLTPGLNGQVAMKYANGITLKFIQQGGPMGGAIFIGEKGKLEINRNKFTSNPPEIAVELKKKVDVVEEERKWSDNLALWQARWHMQNWIDCIRSRKTPVSDVEIGHRSITVCHIANITRYEGRPLVWDPVTERFEDTAANRWVVRPRRKGYELPG